MPDQQPIIVTITAAGRLCSLWSTFVFLSCIVLDWQQPGSQLSDPEEENRLYLEIIVFSPNWEYLGRGGGRACGGDCTV